MHGVGFAFLLRIFFKRPCIYSVMLDMPLHLLHLVKSPPVNNWNMGIFGPIGGKLPPILFSLASQKIRGKHFCIRTSPRYFSLLSIRSIVEVLHSTAYRRTDTPLYIIQPTASIGNCQPQGKRKSLQAAQIRLQTDLCVSLTKKIHPYNRCASMGC